MDDHTYTEVQKKFVFIYLDKDYILKELSNRYDSIFKDLNTLKQIYPDRK